MRPVVDLHCDLLSYLAEEGHHTPSDPESRCSFPDLLKGGVQLQTLALFTKTRPGSTLAAAPQVAIYANLRTPLKTLPSLENASLLSEEGESLDKAFERFNTYEKAIGPFLYISLTWDEENRFGGGNRTHVGLKEDGKTLLHFLAEKQIALDLSHTSDELAYESLNWIDKHNLPIPILASHSNFRALSPYPRNLPPELAREIIRRKGLIGLNFFAPFVHNDDPRAIARHVEYALNLGGENALCFGADFFFTSSQGLVDLKQKYQRELLFYPELGNASVYPTVLEWLQTSLHLSDATLDKIASHNALHFLNLLLPNVQGPEQSP